MVPSGEITNPFSPLFHITPILRHIHPHLPTSMPIGVIEHKSTMKYISTFEFDSCLFTKKGMAMIRRGDFMSGKRIIKYTIPQQIQRFHMLLQDISRLNHKHVIMVSPPCIPFVIAYIDIKGIRGVNVVNIRKNGRVQFVNSLERQGYAIHT